VLNKSPGLVQFYIELCGRVVVWVKAQIRSKSLPFQVESLKREQDEKVRQVLEDVETI
jgi:hypothetical protein